MLFTSYRNVGYYLGLGAIFLIVSFVFAYDNSDAIKIAPGTISAQRFLDLSRQNLN